MSQSLVVKKYSKNHISALKSLKLIGLRAQLQILNTIHIFVIFDKVDCILKKGDY